MIAFFVAMRVWLFLLLLLAGRLSAQTISGVVLDSATNAPLVFANVVLNNGPRGTITDLNGFFQIQSTDKVSSIRIKYIGYVTKTFPVGSNTDSMVFKLAKSNYQLAEVTVLPSENPADRIIKNVVKNRKQNDPGNLPFFTYKAYEKTMVTLTEDSTKSKKSAKSDTIMETMRVLVDGQDLILTENVYERKFRNGKYVDNVEATRMSGMKKPEFALLFSQMQPFTFYREQFPLGEQTFIGPISSNSWNRYFFNIEDTLTVETDTVIAISYRPKRGTQFDALSGMLHINLSDYALANATANVVDAQGVQLSVQHKYEKLNGTTWFPTQVNTDFSMVGINLRGFSIKGRNLTFNRDVNFEEKVGLLDIGTNTIEIAKDAHKKDSLFWDGERAIPLSERDKRTYHVIDSIGKEMKLDKKMKLLIAASTGYFPVGPIEIDLGKIMDYNDYEGYRLGIGLQTAPGVIKRTVIGGFVAYGFRDKELKYGGYASVVLHKGLDLQLRGGYQHETVEMGTQEFVIADNLSLNEMYRDFVIDRMDVVDEWDVGIRLNPIRGWHFEGQFRHQRAESKHGYRYVAENGIDTLTKAQYAEVRLGARFAPFEKKMRLSGRDIVLDKGPVILWVSVTKGIKGVLSSDFNYWKADLRVEGKINLRNVGIEYLQLTAGWASRALPYLKLYTPRANFEGFSLYSSNSFETMRPNEFLHRYQIAFHQRHGFKAISTGTKYVRPRFVWANNLGFGWLMKPGMHQGLEIKDMRKGYFETGIVIEDLFRHNIMGLGGGVFYRYGPYAFSDQFDNLAFKLSLKIGF